MMVTARSFWLLVTSCFNGILARKINSRLWMAIGHADKVLPAHSVISTCVVCFMAIFFWRNASGQIQIHRNGATLEIRSDVEHSGAWFLQTSANETCRSGKMNPGKSIISLEKVPPNLDLIFQVHDYKGQRVDEKISPGRVVISPLPKVVGGAIIYQLAPRTYFARGEGEDLTGRFSDLTNSRLEELKNFGVDYLWLTGILENASAKESDPDGVKGAAGSYYAIVDKWDVASSLGKLSDFMSLLDRAHNVGLRVLIDLVPNHTARNHRTDVVCKTLIDFGKGDLDDQFFDYRNNYFYLKDQRFSPPYNDEGLGEDGVFDTDIFTPGIQGEYPAKVTGNNVVVAGPGVGDWYETVKLNYGWDFFRGKESYDPIPKTWGQILDVAKYWVELGVDGFRVDFAHAVPLSFWQFFAREMHKVNPDVFLIAEAYESDELMKYPNFSYESLLEVGFDSVYDSYMYWAMYREVRHAGNMHKATFSSSPGARPEMLDQGYLLTRYMENHDEVRLASYRFAPDIPSRERRASLGLGYTAYLALMPGHLMLQGGQEFQEDAEIYGPFAGYDGRTSIFDYVYQAQTSLWMQDKLPEHIKAFRSKYRDLVYLKRLPVFRAVHTQTKPSMIELEVANSGGDEFRWLSAYIRFLHDERYLVVSNADPANAHLASVYFGNGSNIIKSKIFTAVAEEISSKSFRLSQVWSSTSFGEIVPIDRVDGVASNWSFQFPDNSVVGVFLGWIPAGSTYVFKIEEN